MSSSWLDIEKTLVNISHMENITHTAKHVKGFKSILHYFFITEWVSMIPKSTLKLCALRNEK